MGYRNSSAAAFQNALKLLREASGKSPHHRRDYSFTSRQITKRNRPQRSGGDSFRRLEQSGARGKSHQEFGQIAANSAPAYTDWDPLRLASPNS